jgi:hypothetical protein
MSVFIGGSAYNMVRDIADGFILVNDRTFRKYGPSEIADFCQAANRLLKEVRADQPALSQTEEIQKRQRRMQRLLQALTMASAALQRKS